MTEKELKDQINRAERARQLLKDPLIVDSLANMRETVYTNIRTSHYKDIDDREDCYKMLKVIDKFEGEFQKMIRDGKVAETKLGQLINKIRR